MQFRMRITKNLVVKTLLKAIIIALFLLILPSYMNGGMVVLPANAGVPESECRIPHQPATNTPEGHILFDVGGDVIAINPTTMEKQVVATQTLLNAMSSDGRYLLYDRNESDSENISIEDFATHTVFPLDKSGGRHLEWRGDQLARSRLESLTQEGYVLVTELLDVETNVSSIVTETIGLPDYQFPERLSEFLLDFLEINHNKGWVLYTVYHESPFRVILRDYLHNRTIAEIPANRMRYTSATKWSKENQIIFSITESTSRFDYTITRLYLVDANGKVTLLTKFRDVVTQNVAMLSSFASDDGQYIVGVGRSGRAGIQILMLFDTVTRSWVQRCEGRFNDQFFWIPESHSLVYLQRSEDSTTLTAWLLDAERWSSQELFSVPYDPSHHSVDVIGFSPYIADHCRIKACPTYR